MLAGYVTGTAVNSDVGGGTAGRTAGRANGCGAGRFAGSMATTREIAFTNVCDRGRITGTQGAGIVLVRGALCQNQS